MSLRSQDQVNRAQNADQTAKVCERFVYSRVKMTRLYDYQTWHTHFCRNSWGAQRLVGFYFLVVLFRCWLAGFANSDHMDWGSGEKFSCYIKRAQLQQLMSPNITTLCMSQYSIHTKTKLRPFFKYVFPSWAELPHCYLIMYQ